jgi:hypothetical protein
LPLERVFAQRCEKVDETIDCTDDLAMNQRIGTHHLDVWRTLKAKEVNSALGYFRWSESATWNETHRSITCSAIRSFCVGIAISYNSGSGVYKVEVWQVAS